MRMHAMMQNTPSQISSALPQMLRASVYQTAMKAAPRHRQTAKPRSAPNHTCKHESAAVHREQQRRATCLIRRLRNAISSSPIAFLMNERRTETMIDASSVSTHQHRVISRSSGEQPRKTMKKMGTENTLTVIFQWGRWSQDETRYQRRGERGKEKSQLSGDE